MIGGIPFAMIAKMIRILETEQNQRPQIFPLQDDYERAGNLPSEA